MGAVVSVIVCEDTHTHVKRRDSTAPAGPATARLVNAARPVAASTVAVVSPSSCTWDALSPGSTAADASATEHARL